MTLYAKTSIQINLLKLEVFKNILSEGTDQRKISGFKELLQMRNLEDQ